MMKFSDTKYFLFCSLFTLSIFCCNKKETDRSFQEMINFNHLERLTETIYFQNDSVDIVHIYADYPDYQPVDAKGEGITCVDDVARAAVVYLKYFELYGDSTVLSKAKNLLKFVLSMQTDDGEFYNFIFADKTINKNHRNSEKSFNFWAARAYWALGSGYKIFKSIDEQFGSQLKQAFLKCKIPVSYLLKHYPQTEQDNTIEYPLWLINQYGSDATSEFLLGIANYLSVEKKDEKLTDAAAKFAEGMLKMQLPIHQRFGSTFLSWKNLWHAWGNSQTQALCSLYPILKQSSLLEAVKNEADHFYSRLLIEGRLHQFRLDEDATQFPQIAYDIRCQALGLLKLYEMTQDKKYAIFAGLTASWLCGNNAANTQMYDPATGRCFDGINDSTSVNKNSGAESTIEALFTLVEIMNDPIANKFLYFKALKTETVENNDRGVIWAKRTWVNSDGEEITISYDFRSYQLKVIE